MRVRLVSFGSLLITAVAAGVFAVSSPASAHCSGHPSRNADSATGQVNASSNIRTFPHVGCTSLGIAQPGQTLFYHCFAFGDTVNGVSTWTHLRRGTTNGWVNDSLLNDGGSFAPC